MSELIQRWGGRFIVTADRSLITATCRECGEPIHSTHAVKPAELDTALEKHQCGAKAAA